MATALMAHMLAAVSRCPGTNGLERGLALQINERPPNGQGLWKNKEKHLQGKLGSFTSPLSQHQALHG